MKRMSILLLTIIAVITVGIVIGASDTNENIAGMPRPERTITAQQQQPAGVIDGAVMPELIPDTVAYTLLFRLLSDRNTEDERNRVRSYLRMALRCSDCPNQLEPEAQRASEEVLIDAVLRVVERFERRVGALDRQAEQIHAQNPHPDSAALARLNLLQQQKEAVIAELVASLPRRLGVDGAERMRRHVNERVKRRVRITPEHVHN